MKLKRISWISCSWIALIFLDLAWIVFLLSIDLQPVFQDNTACFTLIDSDSKHYYQWFSTKDQTPFIQGQWRWNEQPPFDLPWPTIEREQPSPLKVHLLSNGAPPNQGRVAIIYDDWPSRQHLEQPLAINEQHDLKTILFIDQSATMNNPWQNSKSSAFDLCLASLRLQRNQTSEVWEVSQFGSSWQSLGFWHPNQNFPLQSLSPPQGKTKWSDAIDTWLKTKPEPSQLIMIGDGKIEERNLEHLKETLTALKSNGHQITVLSPELKSLESWQPMYQQQLVQNHWPQPKIKWTSSNPSSDYPLPCTWQIAPAALPGKQHQALIWSNEGDLLMSMQWRAEGIWYHLASKPELDPNLLITALQEERKHTLILEVRANQLVLDLQNDSQQPLSFRNAESEELIWPQHWGTYSLPTISDSMLLFHPQFGTLNIKNTKAFCQSVFKKETESQNETSLLYSPLGAGINGSLALLHLIALIVSVFIRPTVPKS